jgi:cold shock CspA family protein
MAQTWQKKEREQKKQQHKKAKEEKRLERKKQSAENNNASMVMAYVDENGNLTATPPDFTKRKKINSEDIIIGVPKQDNTNAVDIINTGIVTHFNEAKGYGFIRDKQTQHEYFVHVNSLLEEVKERSEVTFGIERGPKGLVAINVALLKKS